jgi:hypothetical protein
VTEHGHAHPHSHSHDHRHDAGQGPVVLDVGGDVGALVVHFPASMVGAEIEISPVGRPAERQHVAVHRRPVPGSTVTAAVYPGLRTGDYELWSPEGSVALTVAISGGEVTEARWTHVSPELASA